MFDFLTNVFLRPSSEKTSHNKDRKKFYYYWPSSGKRLKLGKACKSRLGCQEKTLVETFSKEGEPQLKLDCLLLSSSYNRKKTSVAPFYKEGEPQLKFDCLSRSSSYNRKKNFSCALLQRRRATGLLIVSYHKKKIPARL